MYLGNTRARWSALIANQCQRDGLKENRLITHDRPELEGETPLNSIFRLTPVDTVPAVPDLIDNKSLSGLCQRAMLGFDGGLKLRQGSLVRLDTSREKDAGFVPFCDAQN